MGAMGAHSLSTLLLKNTSIKELLVTGNKLGPQGASILAHTLQFNKSLKKLDLSFNEIGPSGAGALASVFKHVSLVSLNLRCNELGPAGGKLIAKKLRECSDSLKILVVADNHIGQAVACLIGQNFKGSCAELLVNFGHKSKPAA